MAVMVTDDPRKNTRTYPVNQPSVGITDPRPSASTQGVAAYTDTGTGRIAGTPPVVSDDGLNIVATPPTVSNDGLNHPAQQQTQHVINGTHNSVASNRADRLNGMTPPAGYSPPSGDPPAPAGGSPLVGASEGAGAGAGGVTGGGGYSTTTTDGTPYSGNYDLSEYLRQQAAARIEAELAGLAGAYEKSMRGYDRELQNVQQNYYNQRNQVAAQDAIARRNFDERAAASGLNSGTTGQADLVRSAAYTGELARLGAAEENARLDLEMQKANAQSQYEQAIAQAKAQNNQDLASALYQEMIRVQGLERQDALNAARTTTTSSGGGGGWRTGSPAPTGDEKTDDEAEAKTGSTIWDAADEYATKYGEDAGLAYVKANYKDLGYSSQSAAEYAYQLHKYDTGRMQQEQNYNNPSTKPMVGGVSVDNISNRITYSPRNEPLIWVEGTPPSNEPQYDKDGNRVSTTYYFKTPTWAQLVQYMQDGVVTGEIRNGKYVYSWV